MNPVLLTSFQSWLINRHYSPATVRNYLVDIGKYLNFVQVDRRVDLSTPSSEIHIFSSDLLTKYLHYLSGQNNSARYLASLNLFCQFAVDQHYINHNPLDQIRHQNTQSNPSSTVEHLLSAFSDHLTRRHKTPSTIKNYLSDIESYFSWAESQTN